MCHAPPEPFTSRSNISQQQHGLDRTHRLERITDDEHVRLQQAATPERAGQPESRDHDRYRCKWQFDVLNAAALRAARADADPCMATAAPWRSHRQLVSMSVSTRPSAALRQALDSRIP